MQITILIAFAVIILGGVLGGAIWFTFYLRRSAQPQKTGKDTAPGQGLAFHWSYIMLPLGLLFLSVILSVYFYHQLPIDVATHFELDGTPDGWLSRGMTMAWLLAPQMLLTLLAVGTTWGITRVGSLFQPADGSGIKPERILLFMGNAFALPQLVVFFAMLDIFSYNSYQRHIMPLWMSILIIVGLVTITLGVLLALLIARAKQQLTAQPDQTKEQ